MSLAYLSEPWCEQARQTLAQLTAEQTNGLSIAMVNCYQNCPDGADKYSFIRFDNGRFDAFEVGFGSAPDADIFVTAEYPVFVKIAKGELSGQSAMLGGKLKLKGNMMKAMKCAALSEAVTKALATIPTEYE